MTVAALPATASYLENGQSVSFPAPFRFKSPQHLVVTRILANGTVVPLVLDVSYTVSGGASNSGGTVSLVVPGPAGSRLVIKRRTPRAQPMVYAPGDRFPAKSHEEALDTLTLQSQESGDAIDDTNARALMVPPGETAPTLPPAPQRAGRKIIGFNALTGALELQDTASFKGDPGGNIMAIGLFNAANGMVIPAGVTLVQTSGYATLGTGAALYTYLPGKTIDNKPGTRFMAADGRVFGPIPKRPISITAAGSDANAAIMLENARAEIDGHPRTSPPYPGFAGWGVGNVTVPAGNFTIGSTWSPYQAIGFQLTGESRYASALNSIAVGGTALRFSTYGGVRLADFLLGATGTASYSPGSVGINVRGEQGGGHLTIERLHIVGFDTCILNNFDGNGDKTLVTQTEFNGRIGFSNKGNTQAIGWTFLNCAGAASESRYQLGGVGMTAIINDVADLYGSYISYPEGSGNHAIYWTGGTTVLCTKIEQHGGQANAPGPFVGQNLLIDASGSRKPTAEDGASNTDLSLIDVHVTASPDAVPDPDNALIITVGDPGDGNKGSDAIRVRQWGGWIRGVIRYCTNVRTRQFRRWSFEHAIKAPLPENVHLLGSGFAPMMAWRGNENVPVDQYRGGQSHNCSIDGRKAFMFHPNNPETDELMRSSGGGEGSALFNGGGAIPAGQTRSGQMFPVPAPFPPQASTLELAVEVDANTDGHPILLEWLSGDGATLIGSTTIPGGFTGYWAIRSSEMVAAQRPPKGGGQIRMTQAEGGVPVTGRVILWYWSRVPQA